MGYDAPVQAFTKEPYNGFNVVTLNSVKATRNYPTNEWATFVEWSKHNYHVKKGQKATTCRYVHSGTKTKTWNVVAKKYENSVSGFYMNYFPLFNRAQVMKRSEMPCPHCKGTLGEHPEKSHKDRRTFICNSCYVKEAMSGKDWKKLWEKQDREDDKRLEEMEEYV